MSTLNEKIRILELEIERLKAKIASISSDIEGKNPQPYTKIGGLGTKSLTRPITTSSGFGGVFGGGVIWNDAELKFPGFGRKGADPTKGYNQHGHSRYAGGALDITTIEFVEYDVDWDTDTTYNKHSQSLWRDYPNIVKDEEDNYKIGGITDSLVWDKNAQCWKFYAVYKDDIEEE
jgi:hypothetical protein